MRIEFTNTDIYSNMELELSAFKRSPAHQPDKLLQTSCVRRPPIVHKSHIDEKTVSERLRRDEQLQEMACISCVLYANINHPELRTEYPNWTDRCEQILKVWRALSPEQKAIYLLRARDNRSSMHVKRANMQYSRVQRYLPHIAQFTKCERSASTIQTLNDN